MDLHKAWQELQAEKFNQQNIDKDMILNAIKQESSSTMHQLRKRLGAKLGWITFFTVGITLWMLFSLQRPELLLILGVFLFYYGGGLLFTGYQYRQLGQHLDLSNDTLSTIKTHERIIKKSLRFEEVFGLIFFPIAVIGGMLISWHYKGVGLEEIMQDPKRLRVMIIAILVICPLGIIASFKMNKHAFGGLLTQLRENIRRMQELH